MIEASDLDLQKVNTWTTDQPLSQLTPFADWDSVAGMIASLRIHLFEYGTIPSWNYMFCGGRPELATPFSWAFTWPSVFAYVFPPVVAILAVWIVMTLVGFASMRSLLRRWTGHRGAATMGACLYVFAGCFSARFNAGHVTFAFYHLVPVIMLIFEVGLEQRLAGQKSVRAVLAMAAIAFLFFSAALPHGLTYFYPAVIVLVVFRCVATARRDSPQKAIRAISPIAVAHFTGAWIASFKVWPAISWQMGAPRRGIRPEEYSLFEVIQNTLLFVTNYEAGLKNS